MAEKLISPQASSTIDLVNEKSVPITLAARQGLVELSVGVAGKCIVQAGRIMEVDAGAKIAFVYPEGVSDLFRLTRYAYFTSEDGSSIISTHINEQGKGTFSVAFNVYQRKQDSSGNYVTPKYLGSKILKVKCEAAR